MLQGCTTKHVLEGNSAFNVPEHLMQKHEELEEVEITNNLDWFYQCTADVTQLRSVISQLNKLIDVVKLRESLWQQD